MGLGSGTSRGIFILVLRQKCPELFFSFSVILALAAKVNYNIEDFFAYTTLLLLVHMTCTSFAYLPHLKSKA